MITEALTPEEFYSTGNHAWPHILPGNKGFETGQGVRRYPFLNFVEPQWQLLDCSELLARFQLQQPEVRQLFRPLLKARWQQRPCQVAHSCFVSPTGENKGLQV
jgi:hypothetical protein